MYRGDPEFLYEYLVVKGNNSKQKTQVIPSYGIFLMAQKNYCKHSQKSQSQLHRYFVLLFS